MLKVRLITALTLLPLVLAAFVVGPSWLVGAFLLLCLSFCVYETASMLIPTLERRLAGGAAPRRGVFPLVAVALGWLLFIFCSTSSTEAALGLVVVCLFAGLFLGVFSSKSIDRAVARAFGILISLCYGGFPWVVVWQLHLMGERAGYILLVMAVVFMGDTGGYFGGRYLGGKVFGPNRLAPVISPKKTWEGAVCGLLMSIVGALILNEVYGGRLVEPAVGVAIGLVGGVFGQLGDLVESSFKRFAGVKDSGTILPGHGGFLDRVDAILFAVPVIWAMLYYLK